MTALLVQELPLHVSTFGSLVSPLSSNQAQQPLCTASYIRKEALFHDYPKTQESFIAQPKVRSADPSPPGLILDVHHRHHGTRSLLLSRTHQSFDVLLTLQLF